MPALAAETIRSFACRRRRVVAETPCMMSNTDTALRILAAPCRDCCWRRVAVPLMRCAASVSSDRGERIGHQRKYPVDAAWRLRPITSFRCRRVGALRCAEHRIDEGGTVRVLLPVLPRRDVGEALRCH